MKVSFPHMGNAYIALSSLLSNLGAEVIVPPRPTRKTIDIGALHAPEFVCLPFKVNLGDNLRSLQMGADTLAMVSGMWACRFGYYGRVQHQILRDAGFEFDSILLGRDGIGYVYNKFRPTVEGNLTLGWFRAFRHFKRKAEAVDKLEIKSRQIRPFEGRRGSTSRALTEGLSLIHEAPSLEQIDAALSGALGLLEDVELDRDREEPLRIAVLGEIYAVLEPSLNFDIERRLGEMGVMSYPVMSVYKWLFRPLKTDPRITIDEYRARRIAKPYIAYVLGGEEHQTIAGTINAARSGYDGVLHLYPFTCMPENICRTILPRIESEFDIPVLNLCLDEHASPTGVATRLEAFVDLLRQRRRKRPPARIMKARS
ncbi:MAG: CoA protein activase [Actinobacteria bacterium]|nr:CoA protein activase [Actinomycetota bacterium]